MKTRNIVVILASGLPAMWALGEHCQAQQLRAQPTHWVYGEPAAVQARLVTIRVQAVEEGGAPVRRGQIVAYCRPWHYCTRTIVTDEREEAVIRGPIGDWTFYAAGEGYLGAAVLSTRQDAAVRIQPDRSVQVDLYGQGGDRAAGSLGLARGTRGSRAQVHFQAFDPIPMLRIGVLTGDTMRLSTTPSLQGRLWITRDMTANLPGFAFASEFNTSASQEIAVFPSVPARLNVAFDGYGTEARAVVSVHPAEAIEEVGRSAIRVPAGGGVGELLLSPGVYRVEVSLPGSCVYLGERVSLGPGQGHVVRLGNRFTVQPMILDWSPNRMHLWFDVRDNYGRPLHQFSGAKDETVRLAQGHEVLHQGVSPLERIRHYRIDRDWRPVWQRGGEIRYEYHASCGPLGVIEAAGSFAADPAISLNRERIPVIASSEHFDVRFLDCPRETATRVAAALERAYSWLANDFAGPVSRGRGGKWHVQSTSPVGVGWGGGGGIALCVYAAELEVPTGINGNTFVLFHEFGHTYQSSPPHHQARGTDKNTCEAIASLISAYCMRAIHGEPGYVFSVQNHTRSFFDRRIESPGRCETNADDYDFIFYYIHGRFGEAINRKFVQIMYRSEGNLEDLVLASPLLKTEGQRVCAVYSYLTGENLAWLFRWAGEDVPDETINEAIASFKEQHPILPSEKSTVAAQR